MLAGQNRDPLPEKTEQTPFAGKAKDLGALRDAVVDAATVGTGLWLSYLFALFYFAIAAGAVTHRVRRAETRSSRAREGCSVAQAPSLRFWGVACAARLFPYVSYASLPTLRSRLRVRSSGIAALAV